MAVNANMEATVNNLLAVFMVLAGAAEVVTGVRHEFFGIVTAAQPAFTWGSIAIGLCYVGAGLLTFRATQRARRLAIALLTVDVSGRIALVATGLYPLSSARNVFGIILGTAIAAGIALYLLHQVNLDAKRGNQTIDGLGASASRR